MHTENSFYLKKKKEKKSEEYWYYFFSFTSLIVTKFHNRYPPLLWFCIVQILMLRNCYEHVVGC